MSLLSAGDKTKIRTAIKLVTDTFMVSAISLHRKNTSVDIWQEEVTEFIDYTVNGLVEYPDGKLAEAISGSDAFFEIKLTFNIEDMDAADLIDSNFTVPFKATEDYFTVAGIKYRMSYVGYDGPLEAKPVLVIIHGRKLESDAS